MLNLFFSRGEEQRVLTDIMGMEDFLGDMDFKLAATRYRYLLLNIFIVPIFIYYRDLFNKKIKSFLFQ